MRDDMQRTVIIPTCAALVTGALVGLLVLALAAWLRWPAAWAGIAGAGAALLSWFAWSGRMVAILEHRIAPGLASAARMTANPQTVDLRIHEERGAYLEGTFLDRLPVNEQTLAALAGMVLAGGSLTTSQITASGLLSRPTWEALRDRFISAGLLSWRSGNRQYGVIITPRGWAVFRRLADPGSPPTHPPI